MPAQMTPRRAYIVVTFPAPAVQIVPETHCVELRYQHILVVVERSVEKRKRQQSAIRVDTFEKRRIEILQPEPEAPLQNVASLRVEAERHGAPDITT